MPQPSPTPLSCPLPVVLDTNVVLDVLVFDDPVSTPAGRWPEGGRAHRMGGRRDPPGVGASPSPARLQAGGGGPERSPRPLPEPGAPGLRGVPRASPRAASVPRSRRPEVPAPHGPGRRRVAREQGQAGPLPGRSPRPAVRDPHAEAGCSAAAARAGLRVRREVPILLSPAAAPIPARRPRATTASAAPRGQVRWRRPGVG